jgi:sterol desaturase/sphingolipid hydroxylase (fatty acid hydroxylase superfamily)
VSTNDYGEHYSLWERMFGPEHPDDPHAAAQRISEVLRNEIEVVDA